MAQETIFVQTDPSFSMILGSLKEMKDRFQVTYMKTVSIENIESDNEANENMFGGSYGFTRTAAVIARMCMLTATNIPEELWPQIGPNSSSRNKAKLIVEDVVEDDFKLADNLHDARNYLSKYDQQYPHFVIEHEIESVEMGNLISLPSMMLIVKNDLTKAIEITTTLNATRRTENEFNSYVHVICIVRSISPLPPKGDKTDGRFTELLKVMLKPKQLMKSYVDEIEKAITKKDWKDLPVALKHLKIVENENEGLQEQQDEQQ